MDAEDFVVTSDPEGFVPAAIQYEDNRRSVLCSRACGVVPIPRRPLASRPNYRSGVVADGALPGAIPGRDFVTGVSHPSTSGVRGFGF